MSLCVSFLFLFFLPGLFFSTLIFFLFFSLSDFLSLSLSFSFAFAFAFASLSLVCERVCLFVCVCLLLMLLSHTYDEGSRACGPCIPLDPGRHDRPRTPPGYPPPPALRHLAAQPLRFRRKELVRGSPQVSSIHPFHQRRLLHGPLSSPKPSSSS